MIDDTQKKHFYSEMQQSLTYSMFSYSPPIYGASAGTAGLITGAAGSLGYNEVHI